MDALIGIWIQIEGQPYAGLWFEFAVDGTFSAVYEPMSITSEGTFTVSGDEIDMDQTSHSLGMVGAFAGLFEINGDELKMALAGGPGQARPANLENARIYKKQN